MQALTQEIKKEIIANFHSEMLGFQDKAWRERYADYFLPESAVAQLKLSSSNITAKILPHANGGILGASTTTFSAGTAEMLDILKSGEPITMAKFIEVAGQTIKWSEIDAKWRALIITCTVIVVAGLLTAVALLCYFQIQKRH